MAQHYSRKNFLQAFWLMLLILLGSCVAQSKQSQLVVPHSRPAGWLLDGSKLLVDPTSGIPFFISTDGLQPHITEIPPDIPKNLGDCISLSSDGASVLYIRTLEAQTLEERYGLYRLDLSSQIASLLLTGDWLHCPAWSFNNQHIAIAVRDSNSCTIRILTRDGQEQRDILPGFCFAADLDWSPDGRTIAFSDGTNILVIDLETGRLINGISIHGVNPAWSPNGRYIAYIEQVGEFRHDGKLVISKLDGSQRKVLADTMVFAPNQNATDNFAYMQPKWSPRGDYIAARRIIAGPHPTDVLLAHLYDVILVSVDKEYK
jgi:dipeptidyl aminopeptidase/acylaminoacyl peptidase